MSPHSVAEASICLRREYACLIREGLKPSRLSAATQRRTTSPSTSSSAASPKVGAIRDRSRLSYEATVFGFSAKQEKRIHSSAQSDSVRELPGVRLVMSAPL